MIIYLLFFAIELNIRQPKKYLLGDESWWTKIMVPN